MLKYFSWIFTVPLAVVILVFSIVNRALVPIEVWPLPFTFEIPVNAFFLSALAIGVFWGGFSAWLAAGNARRRAREQKRRADHAELQIEGMQQRLNKFEEADRTREKSSLPIPADAA